MLSNISMVQQLWWKNNNSIECVDEDIYAATLLLVLTHWLHVVNSVLASATVELYTVYISAHLTYQKPPYRHLYKSTLWSFIMTVSWRKMSS